MMISTNFKIIAMVMITFSIACNSTMSINEIKSVDVKSTSIKSSSKSFEGKIIYSMVFEDKTGMMTKEQAKMFMGSQQVYTIKGSKYKSEMDGMMKMTQYYLGQDTLYSQIGGMNNLLWIDATSNPDKLIDYTIKEDVETIAGIQCDLLTINSTDGITKYYFNENYSVNPSDYENHKYGFWKLCMEKAKALPLKSITETKDIYIEIVAMEIKEMEIDDAEFELPNLPRVKSPEE